jgi:hypothetical protein
MSKSAKQLREEMRLARLQKALKESAHIVERAKYNDDEGPMPMSFAIAAYGSLRSTGSSPIEITQIFRDMPQLLGEEAEDGSNVALSDMERSARQLGVTIKSVAGEGVGFVLVLYNYGGGDGANMTYLSSGNRSDTIKMLRELVGSLEAEQAKTS